MTIGEKIKDYRKKAGFTQKQLAKECGVAEITIRQYESGKRQPRYEQLQIIAKALNMHLFEFLDDEYFDAATDEEPGSEENEARFFDEKSELIKNILSNKEMSKKEKNTLVHDIILQSEIVANMHLENARLGDMHLFEMYYDMLNEKGREKARELFLMLTKVPEYLKENNPDY